MPPKRARLSRSRQTTPQSPPKPSATRTSPRQTRTSNRSQSRDLTGSPDQRKTTKKPLPAVNEEDDSEDGIEIVDVVQSEIPSDVASSSAPPDDSPESDASIDDTSSNGTTQLEALDTDLIVDSLADLHQDATKILSFFDTENVLDVVRDLNIPPTKTAKRFRNHLSRFDASRESFGTGSYISVPLILRKIADDSEIVEGPWRPDPVLQLANLSILIASLAQNNKTVLHDTLDRMFNTFPEPFLETDLEDSDALEWFRNFRQDTLAFDIALRTQFFISAVEKSKESPSFDPDDVLKQVFFDEEGDLYGIQQKANPTPSEIEATDADELAILKHLEDIRRLFTKTGNNSIDLARLRKRHSWQEFLLTAFKWIFSRKHWLDSRIKSRGGVEAIQKRIETKDFASSQRNLAQPSKTKGGAVRMATNLAPKNAAELQLTPQQIEKRTMAKRIAYLKKDKVDDEDLGEESGEESSEDETYRNKSKQSPPPHRSPLKSSSVRPRSAVTEIPQSPEAAGAEDEEHNDVAADDDDVNADDGDVATPSRAAAKTWPVRKPSPPIPTQSSIVPTAQTRAVLEVARQQAALGNKENIDITRRGFNTKQPSATRIEWNESQTGQKRPRSPADEDESDGDEFETDQRPQKRTRLPRQQPVSAVDEWIGEGEEEGVEIQDAESEQSQDDNGDPIQTRPPPSAQPRSQQSPRQVRSHENVLRPPSSSAPPRHNAIPQNQTSPQPTSRDHSIQPASEHEQINRQAKAIVRMRTLLNPGSNNREPQVRRAWEPDEINRLCDMLAQHGCAWSLIMSEDAAHPDGPRLQRRSQVQLKDKARNLKMDYLKAGQALPPGFRGVTIKNTDKEMLTSLGLPWE